MNLVWKLLRQHISIGQFAGFSLANLLGVLIILFGFQFYNDVLPVFTGDDSFMKNNYIIINKTIGTASTLTGRTNTFSNSDISEIQSQKFVRGVGQFVSANYKVEASMGVQGVSILNSELFLESVPDRFVDVPLSKWQYTPGDRAHHLAPFVHYDVQFRFCPKSFAAQDKRGTRRYGGVHAPRSRQRQGRTL